MPRCEVLLNQDEQYRPVKICYFMRQEINFFCYSLMPVYCVSNHYPYSSVILFLVHRMSIPPSIPSFYVCSVLQRAAGNIVLNLPPDVRTKPGFVLFHGIIPGKMQYIYLPNASCGLNETWARLNTTDDCCSLEYTCNGAMYNFLFLNPRWRARNLSNRRHPGGFQVNVPWIEPIPNSTSEDNCPSRRMQVVRWRRSPMCQMCGQPWTNQDIPLPAVNSSTQANVRRPRDSLHVTDAWEWSIRRHFGHPW